MAQRTLLEACRLGEALAGELVIDCHAHLGPWHAFYQPRGGSPEAMLGQMDRLGISAAICSAHLAIGPDHLEGNRQVMAAHEQHPDRLLIYLTYNPRCPWAPTWEQAEQLRQQGKLCGFKLHVDLHQVPSSDARYLPVYEYANEHNLPVLGHCWNGTIEGRPAIVALSKRYPRMKLLAAHSHNGWETAETLVKLARPRENIYLDMAGLVVCRGMLRWMVGNFGAHRILFGTDMPFIDARPRLGYVLMADLSDDDKRLILGLNTKRLLGR